MKNFHLVLAMLAILAVASCTKDNDSLGTIPAPSVSDNPTVSPRSNTGVEEVPDNSGVASVTTRYVDSEGAEAYIPADFRVSNKVDERTIRTGLVVIAPDNSEYVWIPTSTTSLRQREFGRYYVGNAPVSNFNDETNLQSYQKMIASVNLYRGFYIGRYEASDGGRNSAGQNVPASKRIIPNQDGGRIWTNFSPQRATIACEELYKSNPTVQGFFPWGINWDTMLQWLIDSGGKTYEAVVSDSTSWGNYSNDLFSPNEQGRFTGRYEEAKANNIYDLAGNNWEWTQERYGNSYVMRGGGYNVMGGPCEGYRFPAVLRNALPGNDYHPNVVFRVGLFLIP